MTAHRWQRLQWLALLPLVYIAATIYAGAHVNDARAYWSATGYRGIVNQADAFLYTPPFLLAMQPFHVLPWDLFRLVYLVAQLASLVWLVGPVIAVVVVLPGSWSPVYTDLYFGNVMIFTAALTVAGFRNPYWWSVLPFMKVLPGVALLWDGWRPIALVMVVGIASLAVVPGLWTGWWRVISASTNSYPLAGALLPRAGLAIALVLLGRWRGWQWTLPPAVMLAQPVLWFTSLSILMGWIHLLQRRELIVPSRLDRRSLSRLAPDRPA